MAYVGFDDKGYDYFDSGYYILFSADNTHDVLFDYVTKDLSCLPELLEQYVAKKIDTTTFEQKDCPHNDDDLMKMIEVLKSIHPYYRHEYKSVIKKAIGNYFNSLLVYSSYNHKERMLNHLLQKKQYLKRITSLIPLSMLEDEDDYDDLYDNYKKWVHANKPIFSKIEEDFIFNVPQKRPIGFINEVRTQKAVSNMLYFILDISAQDIEKLTTPQRIWLYDNIVYTAYDQWKMSVTKRFLFRPSTRYRGNCDYSLEAANNCKMDNLFNPLYALSNLDIGHEGIPVDMLDHFHSAVEHAKTITSNQLYEEYEIDNLYQLLYLEIMSMIQTGTMIRKCKHCGKYFIVHNRKIVYCDRIDESGIRCSAVGSKQSFQRKMNNEKELKLYSRAYKTHHARVRNGIMSKSDFLVWCTEAKENLNKVRSGKLDISIFEEWLKK